MRFSWSTHLLMFLSLETLTSIIRTKLPILVELIDLVNSVIIFLSQMTLLRWLILLFGSQTVILIVLLLNVFLSSDASICCTMAFPPLRNSDHVVVSVSIDSIKFTMGCPVSLHSLWLFLCLLGWSSWSFERCSMRGYLWTWCCGAAVSGFRLELVYISLIENIRSSLIHLYGFQLLVLLP